MDLALESHGELVAVRRSEMAIDHVDGGRRFGEPRIDPGIAAWSDVVANASVQTTSSMRRARLSVARRAGGDQPVPGGTARALAKC
jgi:hypothetical protein